MSKILMSPQEVADATGMEIKTVRGAISRGEIPAQRFGRLIKVPRWWLEDQIRGPARTQGGSAAC